MGKSIRWAVVLFGVVMGLVGCDALSPYQATPIAVIITNIPTLTPVPSPTITPSATRTPLPTPTPDYTPTPTAFPCQATGGQIIDFRENFSEIARENIRYRVYVPPCYFDTQKRFPVVYLIHGASYREQQWTDIGIEEALNTGILNGTLAPMIVVMPYYGVVGQNDNFPPRASLERVILEELLPQIERTFCTVNVPTHRAIGGISRGGFWAYSIGLRHADVFGRVGGHSAYFPNDTVNIPPDYNPLELALTLEKTLTQKLYLDNGAQDASTRSLQLMSSRLASQAVPHQYVVHPIGEHNNEYWSAHIGEYLAFYGAEWERDYYSLASCESPSP